MARRVLKGLHRQYRCGSKGNKDHLGKQKLSVAAEKHSHLCGTPWSSVLPLIRTGSTRIIVVVQITKGHAVQTGTYCTDGGGKGAISTLRSAGVL